MDSIVQGHSTCQGAGFAWSLGTRELCWVVGHAYAPAFAQEDLLEGAVREAQRP